MTVRSTPPLVKTETAADYVQRHARNPLTRAHAADVQQAIAVCRAAENPVSCGDLCRCWVLKSRRQPRGPSRLAGRAAVDVAI